jgi:hypothetical protein
MRRFGAHPLAFPAFAGTRIHGDFTLPRHARVQVLAPARLLLRRFDMDQALGVRYMVG